MKKTIFLAVSFFLLIFSAYVAISQSDWGLILIDQFCNFSAKDASRKILKDCEYLSRKGRTDYAIKLLESFVKAKKELGEQNLDIINAELVLAGLFLEEKEFDKALKYCNDSLAALAKITGSENGNNSLSPDQKKTFGNCGLSAVQILQECHKAGITGVYSDETKEQLLTLCGNAARHDASQALAVLSQYACLQAASQSDPETGIAYLELLSEYCKKAGGLHRNEMIHSLEFAVYELLKSNWKEARNQKLALALLDTLRTVCETRLEMGALQLSELALQMAFNIQKYLKQQTESVGSSEAVLISFLARIEEKRQNYQTAASFYKMMSETAEKNPDSDSYLQDSYESYARVLFELGKTDESIALLKRISQNALKLNLAPTALLVESELQLRRRNLEAALACLKNCLQFSKPGSVLWQESGLRLLSLELDLGEVSAAREVLAQFLQAEKTLDSETAQNCRNLSALMEARINCYLGNFEAAKSSIKKALVAKPGLLASGLHVARQLYKELRQIFISENKADELKKFAGEQMDSFLKTEDASDFVRLYSLRNLIGSDAGSERKIELSKKLYELAKKSGEQTYLARSILLMSDLGFDNEADFANSLQWAQSACDYIELLDSKEQKELLNRVQSLYVGRSEYRKCRETLDRLKEKICDELLISEIYKAQAQLYAMDGMKEEEIDCLLALKHLLNQKYPLLQASVDNGLFRAFVGKDDWQGAAKYLDTLKLIDRAEYAPYLLHSKLELARLRFFMLRRQGRAYEANESFTRESEKLYLQAEKFEAKALNYIEFLSLAEKTGRDFELFKRSTELLEQALKQAQFQLKDKKTLDDARARIISVIGEMKLYLGKSQEAGLNWAKALQLSQGYDPEMQATRVKLGWYFFCTGKPTDAEALLWEELKSPFAEAGPSCDSLTLLAMKERFAEKYALAERLYLKALHQHSLQKPLCDDYLSCYLKYRLAESYWKQKKFALAEKKFKESFEILKERGSPCDLLWHRLDRSYREMLKACGRTEEEENLARPSEIVDFRYIQDWQQSFTLEEPPDTWDSH